MKRIGGLFDRIHRLETLDAALWRAARGKRSGTRAAGASIWPSERLNRLSEALRRGEFRFDAYTSFEIRDPKSRTIRAPSFRDRVVHHAIIEATGATFERGALPNCFACRLGRGQHAAIAMARRWARVSEGFLKVDIAKYYDSIDHARLRQLLRRRFREERLLELFDRLIDSYSLSPKKGLPIGALTSQYLANFYLDPVDHWLREVESQHRTLRYMDDILIFGPLRELREVRLRLLGRLALHGLQAKAGGVLNRSALGVPWLGFTVYPDRIRLNPSGRRRLRRKLRSAEREYERGLVSTETLV
ncbi:MAG: reverse transcriptase domain-containing protein, partial [Planctomycetota bacterium]